MKSHHLPSPQTRDWGCPVFLWSSTVEKQRVQKPGVLPRDQGEGRVRPRGAEDGRPRGPATAGRAQCKAAARHFGSSDSDRCQCLLSPSRRRSRATRAAGQASPSPLPQARSRAVELDTGGRRPPTHTPTQEQPDRHDAVSVNRNRHASPVQGNGLKSTNKILSLLCIFQT